MATFPRKCNARAAWPLARLAPLASLALVTLPNLAGCASGAGQALEARRESIEREIDALGLADDPAIEAQRAEVDAAMAQEHEAPVLDRVELRAGVVHERDDKLQLLARIPFENPIGALAAREAARAHTEVELAQLAEVSLEQRVRLCGPSLERLVHAERSRIFDAYAQRQRGLLDWNQELARAGLLDEVGATRFELAGRVGLARREPAAPLADPALDAQERPLALLPEVASAAPELASSPELVRSQLVAHHPSVGVHRAQGQSFVAQADAQRMKRFPTLRFIDVGYEPVAYPGDARQLEARVAFEIPFGRAAHASEQRYSALAHGQRSAERALVERRLREARRALGRINQFRRRAAHWRSLLEAAANAEQVALRWWQQRLADPGAIARLLDEVFDARSAVLDAREEAGRAACSMLASTGRGVDEWPGVDSGQRLGRQSEERAARLSASRARASASPSWVRESK